MRLPYAKYTNSPAQIRTIDFKGYCVRPIIEDGQMRDMKNLSSDGYPNLTQRKMRRVVRSPRHRRFGTIRTVMWTSLWQVLVLVVLCVVLPAN